MMQKLKKLLAFALCVVLAISVMPAALAVDGGRVSLRIEGVDGNIAHESNIPYSGESVLELILAMLNEKQVPYTESDGYISAIDGVEAGAFGGWDGWVYYVNGEEAAVSMAECLLEDGDAVLLCYADPYGEPPTLMPEVTARRGSAGIVTLHFTATLTTFDEDWAPIVSVVPVTDALVTVDGTQYTTNSDGRVVLSAADSSKARITVQIEKHDENGKPLVVRFTPGASLDLPGDDISFSDVSDNTWYKDYVVQLVRLGAISGYGDGTFRPTAPVTRAEFIKILACLAIDFDAEKIEYRAVFSDVKRDDWFAPYVIWAVDTGIIEQAAGHFNPSTSLAREDMALFAYNMAVKVLNKALPTAKNADAFSDDAQISEGCKEAVYLLQKAGIISGVGDDTYSPLSSTQRSQAAKVATMIYNLPDER